MTERYEGPEGRSSNGSSTSTPVRRTFASPSPRERSSSSDPLTEDELKVAVKSHLEVKRWTVQVAWERERGIDIHSSRNAERLVIEAKGEVANPPEQIRDINRSAVHRESGGR